jgi:hypothetical protein
MITMKDEILFSCRSILISKKSKEVSFKVTVITYEWAKEARGWISECS